MLPDGIAAAIYIWSALDRRRREETLANTPRGRASDVRAGSGWPTGDPSKVL